MTIMVTDGAQESGAKRARETLRAELLALAGENEVIALPGGVRVRVATRSMAEQTRKAAVWKTVTVHVPGRGKFGDAGT